MQYLNCTSARELCCGCTPGTPTAPPIVNVTEDCFPSEAPWCPLRGCDNITGTWEGRCRARTRLTQPKGCWRQTYLCHQAPGKAATGPIKYTAFVSCMQWHPQAGAPHCLTGLTQRRLTEPVHPRTCFYLRTMPP